MNQPVRNAMTCKVKRSSKRAHSAQAKRRDPRRRAISAHPTRSALVRRTARKARASKRYCPVVLLGPQHQGIHVDIKNFQF
eukprot:scaffold1396_cov252-Pinguiococcus_pyrenoidosus.AAC.20